jgi:hypothetical protein
VFGGINSAAVVILDFKHTFVILKSEGKRPLGRPRCRLDDRPNIRMDLKEIWYEGVDWMHLAQDRVQRSALVNTAVNLRVP